MPKKKTVNRDSSFYTLQNATTAYKKAKVDAWHLHSINASDFIQFENDYKTNLVNFLTAVCGEDRDTILTEEWLGSWCYQIKKVDPDKSAPAGELFSEPSQNLKSSGVRSVDFRVFAQPSVNFHLLGALWIEMVGAKYGEALSSCVYGNRLRPKPNPRQAGAFTSYIKQLRSWKKNAIAATKELLDNGKQAIVVTADATAYYHSLKPDFLVDDIYLSRMGISLSDEERALTRLLVDAINSWASRTPLRVGLPVGLPVSAFISNLALAEFDRIITNEVKPKFYGRYVDDLLIVLEERAGLTDQKRVWNSLSRASDWIRVDVDHHDNVEMSFVPEYEKSVTGARISFSGEKCRVYFLDPETGGGFVRKLEEQIREVSSEFRLLPEHVGDVDSMELRLRRLLTADGGIADSFRKIETMTFRKVDFTGFMKEMEFFHRTLTPVVWERQRRVFYKFVRENVLTLKHYAEYEKNLFQVISMAVCCGDFAELKELVRRLFKLIDEIKAVKCLRFAHPRWSDSGAGDERFQIGDDDLSRRWVKQLLLRVADVIQRSYNCRGDAAYQKRYDAFVKYYRDNAEVPLHLSGLVSRYNLLALVHDLSEYRYVDHLYRTEIRSNRRIADDAGMSLGRAGLRLDDETKALFDETFMLGVEAIVQKAAPAICKRGVVPYALLFPTRPLLPKDLFWFNQSELWVKNSDVIMEAFRGFQRDLLEKKSVNETDVVVVPNDQIQKPRIALVNMVTEANDVADALRTGGVPDENKLTRLCKIIDLVNYVLRREKDLDYLVFHELAMPAEWFISIAERCAESGVSIVSGIDYMVTDESNRRCVNPVWMSLVNENQGFRQPVYICETKRAFSYDEETEVNKFGFDIDCSCAENEHAVIKHGEFCFSTLICSELTDIWNRSRLRGLVDALFVLAWNQDVRYFASLIESSTLDLNAYIVQCNNNKYGDSRIRVPAKEEYERDLIRLRGGDTPYYVCGTLDIAALRTFQEDFWANRSGVRPDGPFKPLPMGYRLYTLRFPDSEFATDE